MAVGADDDVVHAVPSNIELVTGTRTRQVVLVRELGDKVAVVTGGAGGIGKALGRRFGQEGVRVVLADVLAEPLSVAVTELLGEGIDVTGVLTDVTSYESVCALRDAALETYGAV